MDRVRPYVNDPPITVLLLLLLDLPPVSRKSLKEHILMEHTWCDLQLTVYSTTSNQNLYPIALNTYFISAFISVKQFTFFIFFSSDKGQIRSWGMPNHYPHHLFDWTHWLLIYFHEDEVKHTSQEMFEISIYVLKKGRQDNYDNLPVTSQTS